MNISMKNRLILLLLLSAPLASHAALVTSCGTSVCYKYDDAQTTAFGTPTFSGDSVSFTPTAFRAESLNAQQSPVNFSSSFFFDQVYANSGFEISSIQVSESGNYRIYRDNSGSPDTVSAGLSTTIANLLSSESISDTVSLTRSGNSGGVQLWSLQSNALDPASAFTSNAQGVSLLIQDNLSAFTDELGGLAWIQKTYLLSVAAASRATTNVPEPSSMILMLAGLSIAGVFYRLRRSV